MSDDDGHHIKVYWDRCGSSALGERKPLHSHGKWYIDFIKLDW